MQRTTGFLVVWVVAVGCGSRGVTVRDEHGRVRTVISASGIDIMDQEGRSRLRLQVAEDGRPSLALEHGKERAELASTDAGWTLSISTAGRPGEVALVVPTGGDACLRVGPVTVGCRGITTQGIFVEDEEGRVRAAVGMEGPTYGLSVYDDRRQKRVMLYTAGNMAPALLHMVDQGGRTRVHLGADDAGGWMEVRGSTEDGGLGMDAASLTLRTAGGELRLAAEGRELGVSLARDGAAAEMSIGEEGAPAIVLRDRKGGATRIDTESK